MARNSKSTRKSAVQPPAGPVVDYDARYNRATSTGFMFDFGPLDPVDETLRPDVDEITLLDAIIAQGKTGRPAGQSLAAPGSVVAYRPKYVPGGYLEPDGKRYFYRPNLVVGPPLSETEWERQSLALAAKQAKMKAAMNAKLEKYLASR